MLCCAVGVETAEQMQILDDAGCDLIQGFYIGSPLPAAKLPQSLAEWTAKLHDDKESTAARRLTTG
jgi:EAL domain-containing protein (putative c-di-GMP-specific phosphodiesterase class I)